MLRELIESAIRESAGDPAKAAVAVCIVLEDEIGLSGNGWFDGDEVMDKAFDEHYAQPE